MTNVDTLIEGLKKLDISIDDNKVNKFKLYKQLLKEWNEKINITAITDDKEIDIKHFLDSMTVVKTGYIKEGLKVIDIGTGGGFPGIPVKIIKEDIDLVLLDSLNKRIKFLDDVIFKLDLKNVKTIHGRAEDYGKESQYREQFDIAVSRAVASLNILLEYCLPFVKVGGYFIAMKGPDVEGEINEAQKALEVLGGSLEEKFKIDIPFSELSHTLLIIKKVSQTPTKYPRKPGKPKKRPL
ncbi:16S rRNA (guanine(527)-N(7))-methyltransferase RsmG [Thermohalobacter berrensis]|uniref:Ribosomal RNA small subunit methyltransferase G n=1 Tax=Thermohalobacter berrensis TaxID=99594 RepID=A0A419T1S6_9FIRM|nr:16S rRNA (guanine(527)-N(7))-methyltransferase RsmG [Thermohalobacter berrensis]RKD31378.1 16S rRNA methyltransferase G [Thermohalobacter berrensis]